MTARYLIVLLKEKSKQKKIIGTTKASSNDTEYKTLVFVKCKYVFYVNTT